MFPTPLRRQKLTEESICRAPPDICSQYYLPISIGEAAMLPSNASPSNLCPGCHSSCLFKGLTSAILHHFSYVCFLCMRSISPINSPPKITSSNSYLFISLLFLKTEFLKSMVYNHNLYFFPLIFFLILISFFY